METEEKTQLWYVQDFCVGYSATLEITHQGEPRRATEHLSFQGSVTALKFKVSFLVFNTDTLLIN